MSQQSWKQNWTRLKKNWRQVVIEPSMSFCILMPPRRHRVETEVHSKPQAIAFLAFEVLGIWAKNVLTISPILE